MQTEVQVIDDPAAAAAALDPIRSQLLAALAAEPASAAGVAAQLGLVRQKVRYHLRTLEEQGLVAEVEQRQHGGLTERIFAATSHSYVVSPAAMGEVAADPKRIRDRLSAGYLVALAARAVREVGSLLAAADAAGKQLPTLSIDTDVRFSSPADRAAFADDLAAAVRALVSRYHDEAAPHGRWYRVVTIAHPRPRRTP